MKNSLLLFWLITLLFSCQTISQPNDPLMPKGQIYFSFDDGPNNLDDSTEKLLNVLKKYEVKALFALLGVNAEANPALVKRMVAEGHTVINHGYNDRFAVNMSSQEFRTNLLQGQMAIEKALGSPLPKLYRPNGGFYKKKHQVIWQEEGFKLVNVQIRAYDAVAKPSQSKQIVKKMKSKIAKNPKGMLLLHDARDSYPLARQKLQKNPQGAYNRQWVAGAVEEIILSIQEQGLVIGDPATQLRP